MPLNSVAQMRLLLDPGRAPIAAISAYGIHLPMPKGIYAL
jgi:hypothetical protein